MDWILAQMRLVDTEDEQEKLEQETVAIEKSWLELVHWKKEKVPEESHRVFFKIIQSYADCKQVIDNYKLGVVCVYSLDSTINPDAQGMMNYICGGIYALDGEVSSIGANAFIASVKTGEELV